MKLESQFAVPHEDMKHRDTLLKLLKERAYRKGQYTLSSGKESEHYVNCKPVTLSCEGNALLSHMMIKLIEPDAVAVGGLTLGADPLVCGIAQKAYYKGNRHLDALIIRKKTKGSAPRVRPPTATASCSINLIIICDKSALPSHDSVTGLQLT